MYVDNMKAYGTNNNRNTAGLLSFTSICEYLMEQDECLQIPVNTWKTSAVQIGTSENVEHRLQNCSISYVSEERNQGDRKLNFKNSTDNHGAKSLSHPVLDLEQY